MNQVAFKQSSSDLPVFPDHLSYMDGCLELATSRLMGYDTLSDFEKDLPRINAYNHLALLEAPRNIVLLDDNTFNHSDYIKAWKCIMDGRLFSEHLAAGEGTRLNLGTKYLVNVQKEIKISESSIPGRTRCNPFDLLPLSLGVRHMLQYAYDIYKLAKSLGYDPKEVLSKQKMLIVLNEDTADIIIDGFINHRFYGFARQNVLFMIQEAYHGINLENNIVFYDGSSPKRLHNHGHIAIEQTMLNQIFYITETRSQNYLTCDQFGDLLKQMEIKISYNIEDLDYLTGSIDHEGLALALKKSKEGYNLLMEVVPNHPDSPQKGGMAAFDPILEQDVMIESFQLNGLQNHQIKYLNKNINYYPNPYIAWEMVKKQGLNMHMAVKGGYLYFQPVIGDINFLVKTALFSRKNTHPINAWKSAATTPLAVKRMHMQDMQKGFKAYASVFVA